MKKLTSLLLVIVMLVSLLAVSANAAANPAITVKSVSVCPGKEVSVDVSISGNSGFDTCLIKLDYNKTALELTGFTMGLLNSGGFTESNKSTGKVAYVATSELTGDGVLFTATFTVKDSAEGSYDVKAVVEELTNASGNLTASVTNGKVTAAHSPAEDDGNCMTAVKCSACGAETTPAQAKHTPGTDDGDCTTAITCTACGTVTTAAKSKHAPAGDDGDCTTAVKCTNPNCNKDAVPAQAKHIPAEDDGNCTTAVKCTNCSTVITPANPKHTPNEDDGDCTTAITCSNPNCDAVLTAAKAKHTAGADDGDCTTAVKCTVCEKDAVPAKTAHTDVQPKDHKCDDCKKTLSEHTWADATCTDAKTCSYCGATEGKPLGHTDADKDNICDVCEDVLACDHKDENKDHKCDTCGETISECADTDKDHLCDTCGKTLSRCSDRDKDHLCDTCGKETSQCSDRNKDHKCDTCGETMSECADENKDHKCDTCGKALTECADENKDHKCDTCGKALTECADENKDHKCDTCGKVLSECADANKDGKCDICGTEVVNENIDRVFGSGRVETALEVAKALKETLGVEKFNAIIIANGENNSFADALTGSYLANKKGAPILLYRNSGMSAENMEFIANNLSSNGTVYLLGGTGVIPASVEASLSGYNVKRLAGENRFDTNLAILKEAGVANEEILIARGFDFADSLSASATGLPILVVNEVTSELTEAQITYLKQLKGNKMTIIGGPKIITEKLEAQIEEVIGAEVGRLYGDMREDTSVMIAEKYIEAPDFAVIAYSRTSPDGLCGGPLAYAKGAPLLLTNVGQESKAAAYIAEAGIDEGYVLGGTAIVSDSSVKQIFGLADNAVINTK